jgi:hypothetical protein
MIVTLEQDENGDLILPLGDELCKEVGWEIGDTIVWTDNGNGSWSMTKKPKTKIVLVDTVLSYRMRYAVEVPEDRDIEQVLDIVQNQKAAEFSQQYLGEHISAHRVVSNEQFLAQFDADNDYLAAWTDEQKFNTGLTKFDTDTE